MRDVLYGDWCEATIGLEALSQLGMRIGATVLATGTPLYVFTRLRVSLRLGMCLYDQLNRARLTNLDDHISFHQLIPSII